MFSMNHNSSAERPHKGSEGVYIVGPEHKAFRGVVTELSKKVSSAKPSACVRDRLYARFCLVIPVLPAMLGKHRGT